MRRRGSLWAVLILAVLASLIAVLCQIGYATFVRFPARISAEHYVIYAALWSAVMLPLVIRRFTAAKLAILLVFICGLAIVHFVPLNSRERFLRDLRRIKPGMTAAEVETIMAKYMKNEGLSPWPMQTDSPKQDHPVRTSTPAREVAPDENGERLYYLEYRHTEHGDFCGDQGIVHFEEGKVSRVEFLPD
jgi:hypothetical protein